MSREIIEIFPVIESCELNPIPNTIRERIIPERPIIRRGFLPILSKRKIEPKVINTFIDPKNVAAKIADWFDAKPAN